jgi:hypothetical protein
MLAHRRQLLVFLASCAVLIAAACLISSPFPAPSTSLLDPDDPNYRLSPPSSGEYYNVWDPANNVHESHYNGVFQRGGPFDRDLHVGGGRLRGSRRVYKVGNFELGSGAAAQHAYATIMAAIKTAYARVIATHIAREYESRRSSDSFEAALSASFRHSLASQARRIRRISAHTHIALVDHARAIRKVRRKVVQLDHEQAIEDRRLHVLLNNQHALARLGASAYVKAKHVSAEALRAEIDAAHAKNVVSTRVIPRILSLQRTHNENVAYILRLAHALMNTNALVRHECTRAHTNAHSHSAPLHHARHLTSCQLHDLTFKNMEQIKADIESGAVRQDSLETLISLLTKHTDQRFVKVAKEMKKQAMPYAPAACATNTHCYADLDTRMQGDVVEGVHERMDKASRSILLCA